MRPGRKQRARSLEPSLLTFSTSESSKARPTGEEDIASRAGLKKRQLTSGKPKHEQVSSTDLVDDVSSEEETGESDDSQEKVPKNQRGKKSQPDEAGSKRRADEPLHSLQERWVWDHSADNHSGEDSIREGDKVVNKPSPSGTLGRQQV